MSVRVVIADDQQLMRTALRTWLVDTPDVVVVGDAADGLAAVRLADRLRPDVVVMDVRMPIIDGIEATRQIVALDGQSPVRVLVITTFDLDEYVVDALRAGASGFVLKDATPAELVHAIRVISAGHAYLSPAITRRLLDLRGATLAPMPSGERDRAFMGITPRELAVLRLVARGMTNHEIAVALELAPSSVKTHVGHLLAKLGFSDRVQLVVFAYEHELIRPGCRD